MMRRIGLWSDLHGFEFHCTRLTVVRFSERIECSPCYYHERFRLICTERSEPVVASKVASQALAV
jgi:hypothetical protein